MKLNRFFSALLVCLLCLLLYSTALAAPAYEGLITVTEQATGKQVNIRNYGDEYFHFCTDAEGYLLVGNNGYYYYVREQDGHFALDGRLTGLNMQRASQIDDANERIKPGGENFRDKLTELRSQLGNKYDQNAATPQSQTGFSPIPLNYYQQISSDGSIDAAKDYFNYNNAREGLNPPPKTDSCPLLVLHIEFKDAKAAFDDAAWHKRIFDDGVANYYSTVSNGKFRYTPAVESSGHINDGVITVTLPINAPRWAKGDAINYNINDTIMTGLYHGDDGKNYAIYNESSLFLYGMIAAQQYIDISSLDRNGDGYISPTEMAFVLIFTGFETSYSGSEAVMGKPAVWAHSWSSNCYLYTPDKKHDTGTAGSFTIDGVKLYKYTIIGECTKGTLQGNGSWSSPSQMQYGTICHELGHDLGTMDLYNTLWGEGITTRLSVNALSIMAGGNWGHIRDGEPGSMPTHFDPFDKVFLDFYSPEEINAPGTYTLNATEPSDEYSIWKIKSSDPDVYYLLENRRNVGYDSGLYYSFSDIAQKNGGIVLWRIDESKCRKYWNANELNSHESKYAIMPVFHNNNSKLPFWGGNYYDLGSSTVLLIRDGVEMSFFQASDNSMQLKVRYLPASSEENTRSEVIMNPVVREIAKDANGKEVELIQRELSIQNEDYKELLEQAEENTVVFAAYEVNAGDYGSISFPLSVSFNVGTSYAGETFTVLHKTASGKIERYIVRVDENGKAVILVNELSPFMLFRGAQAQALSTVASVPATGDRNGAAFALLILSFFCMPGLVFALRRRRKA